MSVQIRDPQISPVAIAPGFTRAAVEALADARNDPAWVREQRLLAWRFYEEIPMPTMQDEAWRRTSLRGLDLDRVIPWSAERPMPAATVDDLPEPLRARLVAADEAAGLLVHHDGAARYRSLDPRIAAQGVIFTDLDTAVREHGDLARRYLMTDAVPLDANKFAALHAAFWQGGAFLYVSRNVQVALPLQAVIARSASGVGEFAHTLIVVEEGAEVTLIEDYLSLASGDAGFHSGVVEMIVGAGARLTYISVQDWATDLWNFSTQRAVLGRDSSLVWIAAHVGSRLTKSFSRVALREPGASALMLGALAANDQQHIDLDTYQDHLAPHCTSDLLYKGVLNGRARSVWRGMIWAHKEAQKTNAYQKNENLLLSGAARADSIPGLEIEANDLRCTHGATAGKIDRDQLFYLMSRGIPQPQAERMIVQGFFDPLLARIPLAGVRGRLEQSLIARVGR